MAKQVKTVQEFHSVMMDIMVGPAAQSKRLAAIAKKKLKEVEDRQGVFPYRRQVDGIMDAQEEAVQPFGRIVYFIEAYKLVFDELFNMVLQRSPIGVKAFHGKRKEEYRTLYYNQMWVLIIDYHQVHSFEEGKARTPKPGETWTLVNVMPYGRRLARGWSVQASDGWLELIAVTFNQKYANFLVPGTKVGKRTMNKGCRYEYITPPYSAFKVAGLQGPNKWGEKWLQDMRYPAITIEIPSNSMTGN